MDVVVLDDHRMVAQSIAGVLSEVAGLQVIGICARVDDAMALIRCRPPGLLVLDVELGDQSFRDAVDLLCLLRPDAELLFVTAQAASFVVPDDLAPITIGVVDKAQAWDGVLAVLRAWRHQRGLDAQGALPGCEQQLEAIRRLCPREQRVLRELGCGLLNKEIATRLDLSVATVETYRKSVSAKLGVSGAELVRLATLSRMLSWDAS